MGEFKFPLSDDEIVVLSLRTYEDVERALTSLILSGEDAEVRKQLDAALARQKLLVELANAVYYKRATQGLQGVAAANPAAKRNPADFS